METGPENDSAAVRILPPAVPIVVVLAGIGLSHLWPIDLGFTFPAPERYCMIVAASFCLGPPSILPEEAYLKRRFGNAYLAYTRRVRRWL